MNRVIMLCGMVGMVGVLVWLSYQTKPIEKPAVAAPAPATQYQQSWRQWQEQVAQIKKQYGMDQTAITATTGANEESAQAGASSEQAEDSQSAVAQQSISAVQAAPSMPPSVSARNKSFEKDENQFWQESVDQLWAQQSSQQVVDYFSQTQLAHEYLSVLNDVECRTSRCKVEVVHDSPQAAEEFELDFPVNMAGHLNGVSYQSDQRLDGRIAVVMYLSK